VPNGKRLPGWVWGCGMGCLRIMLLRLSVLSAGVFFAGMVGVFMAPPVSGQPPGPPPARIEVDCSQRVGTIRPMLGVNNGPRGISGKDLTKAYREMGVDFIRTHDFYGPTDLHEIFPDWKADPANPKSYRFESSDQKIKAIVDGGFKVLFRLGESWGGPRKPPPDFEKCAEVCRRIVMHYNEGWADGFRFGIKYWEIWNEPDIRLFWTGTPEQFYKLYELVAKRLKKHDPTLKVGGPASTGSRRYLGDFLKYLREHNVPLDFYSWHFYGGFIVIYGGDARTPQRIDKRVRSALKQAGFEKAESICDEWNWTVLGPNLRGAGNAAFTAAALIAFQDTSVSIQTRYRGDDHLMGMFLRGGKMDKPAYAYKAMRMMLDVPQRVRVTPSYGGSFAALAGLSEDGKKLSLLLADHSQRAGKLSIVIDNFGEEKQKATMAIWVLDSKRDLVKVVCPSVSVRPSIKLEQEFHCPTVQLLQFELDAACGPVMQLTFSDANDEDGAFAIADDGTVYFAWISDRAGNTDVWMKSSRDGVNWNDPWPVVQTPVDDLMNNMVRTSDGRFHLTGRRGQWHTGQFATWDANSVDLINWSQPVQWTDLGAAGMFQESPDGDYWLVFLSGRSGNYDLYIQRSKDKGATWTDPVAITSDPLEDFVFSFRIAPDGTCILVWEQHDASVSGGLLGKSADIYLSTSTNGVNWTPPRLLTPESDKPETDTIPSLIEGPGGQIYAVWITTRLSRKPTVVGVPVWLNGDLSDIRRLPAEGYSVRGQALGDGRYLLAWVETVSGSNHDYFYRILDDFDFEDFEPVSP